MTLGDDLLPGRRAPGREHLRLLRRADPRARGVDGAHSIEDLRRLAGRRTPRPVLDYVEGGAEGEVTLRATRDALDALRWRPHVLRGTREVDLGRTVLGTRQPLPFALGPTGFTRMMHRHGEVGVALAAARAGIPYGISSMSTTPLDRITRVGGRTWFQLYLWRDRGRSLDLLEQARELGCTALVVTVDVPVGGNRERDTRNGLTVPPRLSARTVASMARRPRWCLDALTSEPLGMAALPGWAESLDELSATMFEPGATLDDLTWIRDVWPRHLVVKGVLRADDARAVVDLGADAVVVSDHGGRQLDRVQPSISALRGIVEAVGGDTEVWYDGGVRRGQDVAAALALGATTVLLGRAYLYGLMAGGTAGVSRAITLLEAELRRCLHLLGVPSVDALSPDLLS